MDFRVEVLECLAEVLTGSGRIGHHEKEQFGQRFNVWRDTALYDFGNHYWRSFFFRSQELVEWGRFEKKHQNMCLPLFARYDCYLSVFN